MSADGGPRFLLTRGGTARQAWGQGRTFSDPAEATAALRGGHCQVVVGAVPFSHHAPAALSVPEHMHTGPVAVPRAHPKPGIRLVERLPEAPEHRARVAAAVRRIQLGELAKVVLARSERYVADEDVDPLDAVLRLAHADPAGNGFLVALDDGPEETSRFLVGSSPEILVRRDGDRVTCHPLAGTSTDPDRLLRSAKDHEEHAYVVDAIASALGPLCTSLNVPEQPELTRAGALWHLGTPINGTARGSTSALEFAMALHPTPAVGGYPKAIAAQAIAEIEGDRGFYAGAVGWSDAAGNGEWRVAIRCAEISADRRSLRAWAGGGIVAGSDPDAEFDETTNKLAVVLSAFSVARPRADSPVASRSTS